MFKFGKKRVLALATVAALAVCGIAYAYWTTTGSGSGTALTGTATGVKVNQTSAISGLYPGVAQSLSGNFDNGNSGNVYIASVTAAVTGVTMATGTTPDASAPACTTDDFVIGGSSNLPGEIVSGNGKGSWYGLTVKLVDTAANQDSCKNATIEITYTANAS